MLFGISKRHAEKNTLFALPAASAALDGGEVIVSDRFEFQIFISGEKAERDERSDGFGLSEPDDDKDKQNQDYSQTNECLPALSVGRESSSRLESVSKNQSACQLIPIPCKKARKYPITHLWGEISKVSARGYPFENPLE